MTSEEQYLDELLKNMTPAGGRERTMSQVMADMHWTTPKAAPKEVVSVANLSTEQNITNVTEQSVSHADTPYESMPEHSVNYAGMGNIEDLMEELNSDAFINDSANNVTTVENIGGLNEAEMAGAISAMLDNFSDDTPAISDIPIGEKIFEEPIIESPIIDESMTGLQSFDDASIDKTEINESELDNDIADLLANYNEDNVSDSSEGISDYSETPDVPKTIDIPNDVDSNVNTAEVYPDTQDMMTVDSIGIEEPVTEEIAVEEPAPEESVAEENVFEEPIIEEPIAEEIITEEPIIEEPAVEGVTEDFQPINELPIENQNTDINIPEESSSVDESLLDNELADLLSELDGETNSDSVEEPALEESVAEENVFEEPIIEEPIAEEIITEEPIIDEPAVEGVTEDSQSINELPTEEQDTDININIPEESSSVEESLLDNEIEDLLSELNGDIIPDSDEIISDTTEVSDVPELNDIPVSEDVNNEEPALDYEISDLLSELNGDIMDPSDISDLHGNSEISSDIVFEDSDVSTDLNMNENEPSDVIPDGIQIGDFSDFQDSETGEAMEENADNGSAEWDPVQTAATSSDGELSQEELAAMLNDIGAFDINSMPAEEPVNVNTGDNGTPSALDMLDNLGESDEDLLNLLENLDPQSVNEESNNEINDLLSGERQETKEEKKARKKQEKLQKKEAKKNAKKKAKNSDDQTAVDVDADVFPDTEMINSNDLNDVSADIPDDDNMAVADILQSVSQEDNTSENDSAPDIDGDPELDSLRDISDDGSKKGKKNKKKKDKGDKAPGFWSKFMNMLFAEPEEEEEQEVSNEDIIAEIDAENAEALLSEGKGKPKKAKKKKDKTKGGDNPQGEENPDNIEVPPAKKEKKKKEKPAKEKVQKPKEPKVIVLSKPAKICLITLCITVIAVIIILSSVLPERSDIKVARNAYFKKDYETVYRNLYSVNRNSSDEILFRRAENYLLIKRRWDSYKSRYSIGEKVEALDSLIEGLVVYKDRIEKIDADILDDCNAIYINIIDTLQNVYGLTPDDAYNLYGLEKTDYTNALYTIVFGEKYVPVTIATDEGSDTSAVDSNNNDNQITEGQDSNNEAGNDSAENNNAEDKPETAEEVGQPSEDIALDDMLPGEGDY